MLKVDLSPAQVSLKDNSSHFLFTDARDTAFVWRAAGFLGVTLAAPIALVMMILVKMLHVEDTLGKRGQ
jgi:hypothetical protein